MKLLHGKNLSKDTLLDSGDDLIKLIIDTNVVISAPLKDGISRKLLLHPGLIVFSPQFVIEELNKYENMIIKRTKLEKGNYKELLNSVLKKIQLIDDDEILECFEQAQELIGMRDIKDIPYLAAAPCINVDGIWSGDKDFTEQNKVKVYKIADLIKILPIE